MGEESKKMVSKRKPEQGDSVKARKPGFMSVKDFCLRKHEKNANDFKATSQNLLHDLLCCSQQHPRESQVPYNSKPRKQAIFLDNKREMQQTVLYKQPIDIQELFLGTREVSSVPSEGQSPQGATESCGFSENSVSRHETC